MDDTFETLKEQQKMSNDYVKIKQSTVQVFWKFLIFVIFFFPIVYSRGYVGAKLWEWFAHAHFAVPSMTWQHAAGLSILVAYFFKPIPLDGDKEKKAKRDKSVTAFYTGQIKGLMFAWMVLGYAWIVRYLLGL